MSNLLIRGATDPEGRNVDIAIRDGRIVDAEDAEAAEVIDAGGYMVSPALVEPHYHLTSCFVEPDELVEKPFETQIDKLGRRKQAFTIEDTVERVSRALRIMAARLGDTADNISLRLHRIRKRLSRCVQSSLAMEDGP